MISCQLAQSRSGTLCDSLFYNMHYKWQKTLIQKIYLILNCRKVWTMT